MVSKTEQAIAKWLAGDNLAALAIFSTFKMGLTKDDKETLQIAHQMNSGDSSLYTQMGYDSTQQLKKAYEIIERVWLK